MNIEPIIRRLARSSHWQQKYKLFSTSADKLFKSEVDDLKLYFLHWLEIYHSLYERLYEKDEYLSIEVIESDVRTDAYLVYLHEKVKQDIKERDKQLKSKKK